MYCHVHVYIPSCCFHGVLLELIIECVTLSVRAFELLSLSSCQGESMCGAHIAVSSAELFTVLHC